MFILRSITSQGLELNTCLGIEYVLVLKGKNESEFEERTKLWHEFELEDLYGLVCFDDGASIMPLHKKSSYYVMASDGKTFDNISER